MRQSNLEKRKNFEKRLKGRIRPDCRPDCGAFLKKFGFVSASYPARNPARNRPDSDGTAGLTSVFSSFLSLLITKISSFAPCSAVALERKNQEKLSFSHFNFCFNLEISPIDFYATPYKCWLRWFKGTSGVVFGGEVASC